MARRHRGVSRPRHSSAPPVWRPGGAATSPRTFEPAAFRQGPGAREGLPANAQEDFIVLRKKIQSGENLSGPRENPLRGHRVKP